MMSFRNHLKTYSHRSSRPGASLCSHSPLFCETTRRLGKSDRLVCGHHSPTFITPRGILATSELTWTDLLFFQQARRLGKSDSLVCGHHSPTFITPRGILATSELTWPALLFFQQTRRLGKSDRLVCDHHSPTLSPLGAL